MENEVLKIKDVERSFRQKAKDYFSNTKEKLNDIKLSRLEKRIIENARLEEGYYNRLDLIKKITYTAIQGILACGFASVALVSAVAFTPINLLMALPLTAITFGAAWFCKNNFNESKVEFKEMLEKYNENNKDNKELKLEEKEAKKQKKLEKKQAKKAEKAVEKAEKKAIKETKKLEKENKPSLFKRIINKFKEYNTVDSELEESILDIPEPVETNLDIPTPEEMDLNIPEPTEIKKSKINGITINPITKKVTVTGLKIKHRKGLGIYEVILPKNDQIANNLAEQLLTKYEKLAEYETDEKKVITLRK